jgi:hypothetical protein
MDPRKRSDDDLKRIEPTAMDAKTDSEIRAILRKLHTLPEDEMRIALDFGVPFTKRLEKLTALRQGKVKRAARKRTQIAIMTAPRPFADYFSESDVIRARGLGIRLD